MTVLYEPDLVTAATVFPVSVAEAKKQCQVTHNDDDAYLQQLIEAASDQAQSDIPGGISLLTSTYDYFLPCFHSDFITLPRPPLQSVTTVKYYDSNNTLQTLATSGYYVRTYERKPGVVYTAKNTIWPTTEPDRIDAVQIRYVAGWTLAASVPKRIKHAVLMLVSHWHANREPVIVGTSSGTLPHGYRDLVMGAGYGAGYF